MKYRARVGYNDFEFDSVETAMEFAITAKASSVDNVSVTIEVIDDEETKEEV